jgi:hypothetical protein
MIPLKDAALTLGKSEKTLRRWVKQRLVEPIYLNRNIYFTPSEIARVQKNGTGHPHNSNLSASPKSPLRRSQRKERLWVK